MEEQENTQTQQNKKKFWDRSRIIFALAFVITIIGLIIYKQQNPEISLGAVIGISLLIGIVSGVGIFYESISKKYNELIKKEKEKEIPDAKPLEELKEIIKKDVESEDFQNHIKEWGYHETLVIGDNTIVIFYDNKFLYDKKDTIIAINSNFPDKRSIIDGDKSSQYIWSRINKLSTKPQEEPTKEFSEIFDPTTGRVHRHQKTSSKKKEESKQEKKEDNVV